MSNVNLGDLFQDTSNSIRGKIKNQNEIKPINYPSTINTIQVGVVVPNGTIVNYTPNSTMPGDMPEGMFVNLEETELYKNVFVDIDGATILDSITVLSGSISKIILLTEKEENDEIEYNLYKVTINSSNITVFELGLTVTETYVPKRLIKLDNNIFALLSIHNNSETTLDDSVNVKVFDLEAISDIQVYDVTKSLSRDFISSYNTHYNNTIGVSYSYYNYYVYFTLDTSMGTVAEKPTDNMLCSIAIPKDFGEVEVGNEVTQISFGRNTFGTMTDPMYFPGANNNKVYASLVTEDEGTLYLIGSGFGSANAGKCTISNSLITGVTSSTVIRFDGEYYAIYTKNNGLYGCHLTLTTTENGISTECGSPFSLLGGQGLEIRKSSVQIVNNTKVIVTLNLAGSNDLKYVIIYKNLGGNMACSLLRTLGGIPESDGNYIDVIPNSLVVGIEQNFVDDTSVTVYGDEGGELVRNNSYVATPSVSTIDGITKTEAAQGAIGQAYILNTGE